MRRSFRQAGGWLAIGLGLAGTALASPPCETEAVAQPAPAAAPTTDCRAHAIARTRCIIAALLDDIDRNYHRLAGGGITSIEQAATWTWIVSIGREGHVDRITYLVELDEQGAVRILERDLATLDFGPRTTAPDKP